MHLLVLKGKLYTSLVLTADLNHRGDSRGTGHNNHMYHKDILTHNNVIFMILKKP